RVSLAGDIAVGDATPDGRVLLSGFFAAVVVDHRGVRGSWTSARDELLAASLASDGSVAMLWRVDGDSPREARLQVVRAGTEESRTLALSEAGVLGFDYGGGAALAWAGTDALWLAAPHADWTAIWVGRIDARTGATLDASTIADPFVESRLRFARHAGPGRCALCLDAGQSGGWAFDVRATAAGLHLARRIASDEVTTVIETDAHLLALEGYRLTKRDLDTASIMAELAPSDDASPLELTRGPGNLLLVELDQGETRVVDARAMEVRGRVAIPGLGAPAGGPISSAWMGARRFASAQTRGVNVRRTRVVFWTLPDAAVP
ncbi:MAG: hypothetical protein AB7P00_30220, partial [Sandaracinaceae bacterium]